MYLKELIARLETEPPDKVVLHGFGEPRSYRGFYDQLAFPPRENVRVGDMLRWAKEALGKVYEGYKGGNYTMTEWTEVWLADWGELGESLGPRLLDYMLRDCVDVPLQVHDWVRYVGSGRSALDGGPGEVVSVGDPSVRVKVLYGCEVAGNRIAAGEVYTFARSSLERVVKPAEKE